MNSLDIIIVLCGSLSTCHRVCLGLLVKNITDDKYFNLVWILVFYFFTYSSYLLLFSVTIMHALSKKHYYDVLKTAQEDTIIESDLSDENCERALTSEVGCYARAHLKSNIVQTHYTRANKNFRNEYTATSDDDSSRMRDSPFNKGRYSIRHNQSYEDVAIIRSRSSPMTGSPRYQWYPMLNMNSVIVEHAVDCIECYQRKKKRSTMESKASITNKMCNDKSTQCECLKCKMSTCNCEEYRCIPCNRGLAACRTFSLGTAEARRLQNAHCKSKLIGGCRVPVNKNYKSRF